jgi:23S rRNA (cytosine1962-C5)-methyltransferase
MKPGLIAFENRLLKVWKHRRKVAARQGITCFRFYDHDLPEAPLVLEFLEGLIHGAEYQRKHGMADEDHTAWLADIRQVISKITEVPDDGIFLKKRFRNLGKQQQYEKLAQEKIEWIVKENGLSFILNVTDYLDTGLFLDHRITRDLVRNEARGKRVLNLFCYTGAFSVYASDGGADAITSVDMSRTYINWARRNMQYNKRYREGQEFIEADVLQWIETLKDESFDLIICDPPTYSQSKKMEGDWEVQRDHPWLINLLLRGLAPGGVIFFSNNFREFQLNAEELHTALIKDITAMTTPFDFEGKLFRKCYRISKVA